MYMLGLHVYSWTVMVSTIYRNLNFELFSTSSHQMLSFYVHLDEQFTLLCSLSQVNNSLPCKVEPYKNEWSCTYVSMTTGVLC